MSSHGQDAGEAGGTTIDAQLDLVRAMVRTPLTPDEVAGVRAQLARVATRAAALRTVPLDNADEPAFVFRPDRREQ